MSELSFPGNIEIRDLKCNYNANPIGVETRQPLLSWVLVSDARNQYQTAYRIIAATDLAVVEAGRGDLWDTGIVKSEQSINIRYTGKQLKSGQRCYWKVCVWDGNNQESEWSPCAFFEMGLLETEDWRGKWICSPAGATDISNSIPAPLFRKSINLEKGVIWARAYVCGLGYNELYINGRKITDEVLTPGFTCYDKTVLYNTYDVTGFLTEGENVLGAILGNGWYNGFTSEVWNFRQAAWRDQPKLILQLNMILEDGQAVSCSTDGSWKTAAGPITFDGLRNGEFYDARLERPGWDRPGYHDDGWTAARIARSPGGRLKSSQLTPITVTGRIKPVSLKEVSPGTWVYDIGQNISGWAQLKVTGPAGTEITVKYGEKLNTEGTVDQSNIDSFIKSGLCQTDKYILKGKGIEIWEPRFTYHGFQYVEISGFPGKPGLENILGCVVHTDFNSTGEFECSNEIINRLQSCIRWSTLSNYHSIPTDCPHREKNGWTGDAHLSAEQVLMNFDPVTAYTKWMGDFKDAQRPSGQLPGIVPTGAWGFNWGSGPAWDSAIILIPWYLYVYCGDTSVLELMYENMKNYICFLSSMAEEYVVDFGLGDWCPPGGEATEHKCPVKVTDTAYYYSDTVVMSKVAAILDKKSDVLIFSEIAKKIRKVFRNNFFDSETGIVSGNCQTSQACALYQGLVDEEEKSRVLERLAEMIEQQGYHIDCGILGAKYLLNMLSSLGRTDLAYRIVTNKTFPGWGYWMEQGITTLWESWSGNSSRNHHMFSDVGAWFYKGLAGINPDTEKPGFKHIIFRPNPVEGLEWVNCSHRSPYGRIECSWRVEEDVFHINVEIPVNCHATLYFPEEYSRDSAVELGSGKYNFRIPKRQ